MFGTKLARRDMGRRPLESVQESIEEGRQMMGRALEQGRAAMGGLAGGRGWASRPERPTSPWLWLLVGGIAGAGLMLAGRQARGVAPWAARRVEDVMVREVETIDASAPLTQAAQRMRDANVGVLPVVEGGRLRGVLTDRDIVVRGVARGADLASLRVADCASRDLVAARAEWSVEHAMDIMAMHQVGRLPVVDDGERVIGIVTLSSLALRSPRQDEALDAAKEVSRRSARAV